MLRELTVQNLALIEDLRVELLPGFCAWTGETGAGKSLLLGAIGLLLGDRGSVDMIRSGSEELRITGRFELSREGQKQKIEEVLQSSLDEDDLILSRRLTRSGRSTALVNDQPVAMATLRKLGEMLVDVHGQRESYSLLQPAYQLELLDAFGKLSRLRNEYMTLARRYRQLRKTRSELVEARESRQRELALIGFEREELLNANLINGEEEALQSERSVLQHAQSLASVAALVSARLGDEEEAVSVIIGRLIKDVGRWATLDKRLAEVLQRLETLKPEIQDLADTTRDLSEEFEGDPQRLEEIEARLDRLHKLEKKYSRSLPALIEYRDSLDEQQSKLQLQEDKLSQIDEELTKLHREVREIAQSLSKSRQKIAKNLAAETELHLHELGMAQSRFTSQLEQFPFPDDPFTGEIPDSGIDYLELMLAANPGEPAQPLRKVASGGELSRTMLALKTVLAAHDPVRTLVVFDEIDANVGGRLGDVLGRKLAMLGQSHQVLCVTHLPQVAGHATSHWTIRKSATAKRTTTVIRPLKNLDERIEELAHMLRGDKLSDTTRKEAAEILAAASSNGTAERKSNKSRLKK